MKQRAIALLAILATVAGVAGGLYYAWMVAPVEYYDSAPADLDTQDKLVYLAIVGDLYAQEGDMEQARLRLSELEIEPDGQGLANLIEQYLDGGGQPEDVRNLAQLARDLGAHGGVLLVFDAAATPTPEASPVAQTEAAPTLLPPTPIPEPEFRLVEQTQLCADPGEPGTIAVWVRDTQGGQVPGVQVVVSWPQGQDRFFTGLRPAIGAGYADFQMKLDTEYEVTLAGFRGEGADRLTADLAPGLCPTGTLAADWHLTFETLP
jgi:hypothetical protein